MIFNKGSFYWSSVMVKNKLLLLKPCCLRLAVVNILMLWLNYYEYSQLSHSDHIVNDRFVSQLNAVSRALP